MGNQHRNRGSMSINEALRAPNFLNKHYSFYFQQEEILNGLETTILLGIKFLSYKVLDVLFKNFPRHHGIVDLQLPMSLIFNLTSIQITTTDDERNLSFVIVDNTDQIRAKCDFEFELKDMESFLKKDMNRWEFLTDSKFTKVSTTLKKKQN